MKVRPFFSGIVVTFAALMTCIYVTPASADKEVSVGAQLRFRPEYRNNDDFNNATDDRVEAISQRVRLNVKANIDNQIEGMLSIQDARVWGQTCNVCTSLGASSTPLTSKTWTDLYEAYFQVNSFFGTPADIKFGRQMLVYGDQRLLGHLGWRDQARSFDAFKTMIHASEKVQIDAFLAKLNETEQVNLMGTTATNYASSLKDEELYGVYAMAKLNDPDDAWKNSLDLYYLVWGDFIKTGTDGTQSNVGRNVQTYGLRLAGGVGAVDYTAELALQGGKWTTAAKQSAMAYAVKAGYKFAEAWNTRVGVEYDFGSGDSKSDATTHKTFVFPFHTNHGHYGKADFFSWGNMKDLSFNVTTKPVEGLTVELEYHMFSLANAADDWLNVVGNAPRIFVNTNKSNSTAAGTEMDLTVTYAYSKPFNIMLGYSAFMPGTAAKERSGGKDQFSWAYLQFTANL